MTDERLEKIQAVLAKRQADITVVMENIADPHNIAAILRTCDSVGIQDVYVLNSFKYLSTLKESRASRSAVGWLTVHEFTDTEACYAEVKAKYKTLLGAAVAENTGGLFQQDFTGPVALIFGNERYGITPEGLAQCSGTFIIPQIGMVKSLNVSVACAVTLYEAFRQRENRAESEGQTLNEARKSALIQGWREERMKEKTEVPNPG